MKKLSLQVLLALSVLTLSSGVALAGGDQVHGEKGQGGVNQWCIEPGECPWQ